MCEKPKPGDVCEFTGTLIAVPDVTQLMLAGRHLNTQKALREPGRTNKDVHKIVFNIPRISSFPRFDIVVS
jgi:hypothetical protein